MRGSYVIMHILGFSLPSLQHLKTSDSIFQTTFFERQRPNDILLVLVAAVGIKQLPYFEASLDVGSGVVMLLHEVVVLFSKICGGGKKGVEFRIDDFHCFGGKRIRGGGEFGDGTLEAEELFVSCWVGGSRGVRSHEATESEEILF